MVYGLMIHSVDSSQTLHFSIFYTPEGNDGHKKTRQQTIMRRILEEHLFQTHSGEQAGLTKSKASSSLDDADWLFRFASAGHGWAAGERRGRRGRRGASLPHFCAAGRIGSWPARCACALDSKSSAQPGLDYTEGILRLQASVLFEEGPALARGGWRVFVYPKLVVWKQVDKVVYTLVCEPLDNPLLASNFLTLFVHELNDHFRKGGGVIEEKAGERQGHDG
ncbi:unnamed protein product [Prorocentrum cordatum]|uniref:Uncharacterized protein n=1 Tax=Prorocentrum cordatum TaxID=2364126 RepID=A0ABN9W7I7_9DINO|nr:unnamed protein product [Polarella glacialis]